jgi:hypothetical protein
VDADQLRTLSQWADGLSRDDRPEMRAAARAILLLVEEVEDLRATLLTEIPYDDEPPPEPGPEPDQRVDRDLGFRLRAFARGRFHRES